LRSAHQAGWMPAPAEATLAMSAGAAEEPINVNPDEVTIRAALEVGYRILQDDSMPNG
jgi:hypothetical protein